MAADNGTLPFQVGDVVKIHHSGWKRAKIVEWRGPLAPGGKQVYRVLVRRKPRPVCIEVSEDQLELVSREPVDFDLELMNLAARYENQGYRVVTRPGPAELPPFAKDFQVELVARRGEGGILIQVKRTREELAADANTHRYAEVTNSQPGWKFDAVVLQAEGSLAGVGRGSREPSNENVAQFLAGAEDLAAKGYVHPAVISAWAGLEAAMRRCLRTLDEAAGWGLSPRQMLDEIYSTGLFSEDDFDRLQEAFRLRNEIVHGFAPPSVEPGLVKFLIEIARRLLPKSQPAKQTA